MAARTAQTAPAPPEVRAARSARRSAARRSNVLRRRRRAKRRQTALAVAVLALVAVPATNDATRVPRPSAPSAASRCAVPGRLRGAFAAAARTNLLPLGLLASVARVESGFSPTARSDKGAVGVMQVMPATARSLSYDPRNVDANVMAGAVYLRHLLAHYDGNLDLALAAYNAGPTAVDRAGGAPFGETRAYVAAVERTWHQYAGCA